MQLCVVVSFVQGSDVFASNLTGYWKLYIICYGCLPLVCLGTDCSLDVALVWIPFTCTCLVNIEGNIT